MAKKLPIPRQLTDAEKGYLKTRVDAYRGRYSPRPLSANAQDHLAQTARTRFLSEARKKAYWKDIVGHSIGLPKRGGEYGERLAVRVHVRAKKALKDLPKARRMPMVEPMTGVAIDVVEAKFRSATSESPIPSSARPQNLSGGYGTLGLVVGLRNSEVTRMGLSEYPVYLTCAHVVAGVNTPGSVLSTPQPIVGIDGQLLGQSMTNFWDRDLDAVLVVPETYPPMGLTQFPNVRGIGVVTGVDAANRVEVWTQDASSKAVVFGRITDHDASVILRMPSGIQQLFHHVVTIEQQDAEAFAVEGDSGSAVVMNDQLVAMVIGISNTGAAVAMPLAPIAQELSFTV